MYAVVGCGNCEALWVVADAPETTACPRCGKRRRFAETDDEADARRARAALLAERSGHADATEAVEVAGDPGAPGDAAGVTDEEYLAGAGVDVEAVEGAGARAGRGDRPDRAPRDRIVRECLRDLEEPSAEEVVGCADARGVPPEATRDLLERLVRAGEASENRGRYRLV